MNPHDDGGPHDPNEYGDFGEAQALEPVATRRLSWLGLSALVTGILALPVCCMPVAGSAFALLPVLLGIAGVVVIRRSRGALAGMGMSIAGLVMGALALLVSTLVWTVVAGQISQMPVVYAQAFDEDPAVVRTVLESSTNAKVTDEQILQFHGAFVASHGTGWSAPKGALAVLKGWTSGGDPTQAMEQATAGPGLRPVPVPLDTAGGPILFTVVMDESETLGSGLPALADVGFTASNGELVWLVKGWVDPVDQSP